MAFCFEDNVKYYRVEEGDLVGRGAPTLVMRDLDGNELFVWFPEGERENLEAEFVRA
jgi:hypothetical protein